MGQSLLNLVSRFTFVQKFIFSLLLLLLSLLICMYFNWRFLDERIQKVEQQHLATQNAMLIKKLLENISNHAVMLVSMQLDRNIYQNDIIQMQAQISSDFRKLGLGIFKNTVPYAGLTNGANPEDLGSKWSLFLENIKEDGNTNSATKFSAIADRLMLRLFYLGTKSNLLQSQVVPFFLSDLALIELPKGQNFIAELVLMSAEKKTESMSVYSLIVLLKKHLKNLENLTEVANLTEDDPIRRNLDSYRKIVLDLISAVESAPTQKTTTERTPISSYGIKALRENSFAWNASLERMDMLLNNTLNVLENQRRWVFILPLILSSLALLIIGLSIWQAYQPIQNMLKAVQKFKSGDLATRIPIFHRDEIGGFGILLNQVGDKFEDTYRQLEKTGNSLFDCSSSISDASKQLEATNIEQESSSKQIAINAREISSTAKEFSNTLHTITRGGEEASTLANSGMAGLAKMEATMEQMIEASSNIVAKLAVLNDKAQTVTNIITTISKVAQQTNLLSLNAAIEAEKAGEHGRSFAVISREIRRLAEQTAYATIDIEKMINEMVSAVSSSVLGVDKFAEEINEGISYIRSVGEQLTQVIHQVQQQMKSFEKVNAGMLNQMQGAAQINEAINQWSESAQQAGFSIRKFHQAVEQLTQTSQQMHEVVQSIKQ